MKKHILRLLIGFTIITALAAACVAKPPSVQAPIPAENKPADSKIFDFQLQTLNETTTSLTAIRDGKPAVVEFWGST